MARPKLPDGIETVREMYVAPPPQYPELLQKASQRSGVALGEWALMANCPGINPELFVPYNPNPSPAEEAAAKTVCQSCVVRESDCLQFSLEYAQKADVDVLVLAGLNADERRKVVTTVNLPTEYHTALEELRQALESPTELVAAGQDA